MDCFHKYHQICYKLYYRSYGYRLCRNSGIFNRTKCVILCLLDSLDKNIIHEDIITEKMLEDQEYNTNLESEESDN